MLGLSCFTFICFSPGMPCFTLNSYVYFEEVKRKKVFYIYPDIHHFEYCFQGSIWYHFFLQPEELSLVFSTSLMGTSSFSFIWKCLFYFYSWRIFLQDTELEVIDCFLLVLERLLSLLASIISDEKSVVIWTIPLYAMCLLPSWLLSGFSFHLWFSAIYICRGSFCVLILLVSAELMNL